MCFLTAHWSTARPIAPWYFSGKPGGSVSATLIADESLFLLVADGLDREAEPLRRDPALPTEAQGVEAHARRDRGEEEVERRRRRASAEGRGLVGPHPVALHVGLDGDAAGKRDGDVHAASAAQQEAFCWPAVSFSPTFFRIGTIGHVFVKAL